MAKKQKPRESVGSNATSAGVGKEMETILWMGISYYYYYYCYFFKNCVRCCDGLESPSDGDFFWLWLI